MAETAAQQVAQLLEESNLRLVLAESCTGGMAASLLTQVPGISVWFCGSAVTYREPTKEQWLKVPQTLLAEFTAESQAASDAMALGVLGETPEADIACSITGHLGPGVDLARDGWVYWSMAVKPVTEQHDDARQEAQPDSKPTIIARETYRLKSQPRIERQAEAAHWMLAKIAQRLVEIQ